MKWVFPFWSELEFVKLVKRKRDNEYDFTLLSISNRPQVVIAENYR